MAAKKHYASTDENLLRRSKLHRGKVDARGSIYTRQLCAIGEPGRFYVPGSGCKRGVQHFST